ncbi:MAG: hypothetical protein HRU20_06270 [Pseudomonadales bacterium]|nr:hypothetical protein [Pseudomonadales bacterium]
MGAVAQLHVLNDYSEHRVRVLPALSRGLAGTIIQINADPKSIDPIVAFEKQADHHSQILLDISRLRDKTYSRLYPDYSIHHESYYDGGACILYSANTAGEIISTARVNVAGFIPIPIHESVSDQIASCLQRGEFWAELGRWVIEPEARGQNLSYYRIFHQLSELFSIDNYFMQVRDAHVYFYQKYFNAQAIEDGKGYESEASCTNLQWQVTSTPQAFFTLLGHSTNCFRQHDEFIKQLHAGVL